MSNITLKKGFTIVELLIVIVVIAILAAISIVAYNGIQNRAHASTVGADLSNIAKKIEMYQIDSATSSYPIGITTLGNAGITFSKNSYNAVVYCFNNGTTPTNWAIVVDAKDGKSYVIGKDTRNATEFTANKVQNTSGGTTCPLSGGGGSWIWILQSPSHSWAV